WYLARQDINIENSVATLQVTPRWTGAVWAMDRGGHALGTAIDRWFNGAQRGGVVTQRVIGAKGMSAGFGRGDNTPVRQTRMMTPLRVDEGHAKVAVKVLSLGNGFWRYHYAVMNADVAFVQTTGTEPNLRVMSSHGFDIFHISTSATDVRDAVFRDGDLDTGNDWVFASVPGNAVSWTATALPDGSSPHLRWGMLHSYSITSSGPPAKGVATLYIRGQRGYQVETLVPTPQ
ncbi:MAG: hypothetical protein M3R16_09460, partial [Pseudomonadota bacterium]|nr:hypothetical protein [Pseudomonadota bacterium]